MKFDTIYMVVYVGRDSEGSTEDSGIKLVFYMVVCSGDSENRVEYVK